MSVVAIKRGSFHSLSIVPFIKKNVVMVIAFVLALVTSLILIIRR